MLTKLHYHKYNRSYVLRELAQRLFQAAKFKTAAKKPIVIPGSRDTLKAIFEPCSDQTRCQNLKIGRLIKVQYHGQPVVLDDPSKLAINSSLPDTIFQEHNFVHTPLFNFLNKLIRPKEESLPEVFTKALQELIKESLKALEKIPGAKDKKINGLLASAYIEYHSGTHGLQQVIVRTLFEDGQIKLDFNVNDIPTGQFQHPRILKQPLTAEELNFINTVDLNKISWRQSPDIIEPQYQETEGGARERDWAQLLNQPHFSKIINLYHHVVKGEELQ